MYKITVQRLDSDKFSATTKKFKTRGPALHIALGELSPERFAVVAQVSVADGRGEPVATRILWSKVQSWPDAHMLQIPKRGQHQESQGIHLLLIEPKGPPAASYVVRFALHVQEGQLAEINLQLDANLDHEFGNGLARLSERVRNALETQEEQAALHADFMRFDKTTKKIDALIKAGGGRAQSPKARATFEELIFKSASPRVKRICLNRAKREAATNLHERASELEQRVQEKFLRAIRRANYLSGAHAVGALMLAIENLVNDGAVAVAPLIHGPGIDYVEDKKGRLGDRAALQTLVNQGIKKLAEQGWMQEVHSLAVFAETRLRGNRNCEKAALAGLPVQGMSPEQAGELFSRLVYDATLRLASWVVSDRKRRETIVDQIIDRGVNLCSASARRSEEWLAKHLLGLEQPELTRHIRDYLRELIASGNLRIIRPGG